MWALALSKAIDRKINIIVPDCCSFDHKLLFENTICSRTDLEKGVLNILRIRHGTSTVKAGEKYIANHFVPCIFVPKSLKRKFFTSGVKEAKIPRLQVQVF